MPITVHRHVSQQQQLIGASIASFTASPGNVAQGGASVLTGAVANAITLTLDGQTITAAQLTSGITVNPTLSHTYTLVAQGAQGTQPVSATASVIVAATDIVYNVTPVQLPGTFVTMFGSCKHIDFARVGGRWYKHAGDHTCIEPGNLALPQDGNQETASMFFPTNDFRLETNYYLRNAAAPDSQSQIALPDDGCVSSRNNEVWSFVSERVSQLSTAQVTAQARANRGDGVADPSIIKQEMEAIGAFDVTAKSWRVLTSPRPNPMRGDRLWRMAYDPVRDFFFGVCANGGDMSFLQIDGATGNDISWYGTPPLLQKINFDFTGLGPMNCQVVGLSVDFVKRLVYFYDHFTCRLYNISIDGIRDRNQVPTLIADLTTLGEIQNANDQSTYKSCFHPGVRAVCLNVQSFYTYQVDTGTLSKFARGDGFIGGDGHYVPSSTIFYDPDTQDLISIGGIDFEDLPFTSVGNTVYWRHHLSFRSTQPAWIPPLNTLAKIFTNTIASLDPCPSNQCNFSGGGQKNVTQAWGSAAYSPDYSIQGAIVIANGGDADYFGNEGYVGDLDAQMWKRIGGVTNPATGRGTGNPSTRAGQFGFPTMNQGEGEWDDGSMAIPHTYDSCCYLPPSMGGGPKGSLLLPNRAFVYGPVVSSGRSYRLDLSTEAWTRASSNGCSQDRPSTFVLDTLRQQIFGWQTGSSTTNSVQRLSSFNSSGVGTWSDGFIPSFNLQNDPCTHYLPGFDAYISYGQDVDTGAWKLQGIDAGSSVRHLLAIQGDTLPICPGPGMAFCPDVGGANGCIYIMSSNPADVQFIWKVVPPSSGAYYASNWTSTKIAMAGPNVNSNTLQGVWKRVMYASKSGCILFVLGTGDQVYAYAVAPPK